MNLFNRADTKENRRSLRKNQTDAERFLWSKLRNKQMHGHKFFRQYGIGSYIVDFYCPAVKLGVEVDGGQHFTDKHLSYDKKRDDFMRSLGVRIMRIANNDVLTNREGVLKAIEKELPLIPSLSKRGEIEK